MSGIPLIAPPRNVDPVRWDTLPAHHWNHILSFLSPHDAVRFIKIGTKDKDRPEGLMFRNATKSATEATFAISLWRHNFQNNQEYLATFDEEDQTWVLSQILGVLTHFYACHLDKWASLPNLTKRLFLMYLKSFREPGLGENALGAYTRPMTVNDRELRRLFLTFLLTPATIMALLALFLFAFRDHLKPGAVKLALIPLLIASIIFIGTSLKAYLNWQRLKKKYQLIFAKAQWERAAQNIPIDRSRIFQDFKEDACLISLGYFTKDSFYDIERETFVWENLDTLNTNEGITNLAQLIPLSASKRAVRRGIELALAGVGIDDYAYSPDNFYLLTKNFRIVHYAPMKTFGEITQQKILHLPRRFSTYRRPVTLFSFLFLGILALNFYPFILYEPRGFLFPLGICIAASLFSVVVNREVFFNFTMGNQRYRNLVRDVRLVSPFFNFSEQAKRVIDSYELQREENATAHHGRYVFLRQHRLFTVDNPEQQALLPQ